MMFGGCTVFPPLINAHDHLELNHYPRTKFRDRYDNAHQWGEDVNTRLNQPPFLELRAYPLQDRLFIGGLKNLLCGALIVAHHNPPHPQLFKRDYPVHVISRYGWSHSLKFASTSEIQAAYRKTPTAAPWIIHLAEGTDDIAQAEYSQLKALGCASEKTVIVHGVGLSPQDQADAARRIRGLIWCPTTNDYLLGHTASTATWLSNGGRLALGSDSRLTADGDLLAEINTACKLLPPDCLPRLSASLDAAVILGISPPNISSGDYFVAAQFPKCRSEIALIVRRNTPLIGEPDLFRNFPDVKTVPALLDDVPKAINLNLARQVAACSLKEPGLEIAELPRSRRAWFPKTR